MAFGIRIHDFDAGSREGANNAMHICSDQQTRLAVNRVACQRHAPTSVQVCALWCLELPPSHRQAVQPMPPAWHKVATFGPVGGSSDAHLGPGTQSSRTRVT